MATELQNLKDARANIRRQLKEITENPKPSYSIGSQSVQWSEHFRNLMDADEKLSQLITRAQGAFEVRSRAVT